MYPITHGQYCGANWSDGKYQSSVCGESEPVDELDSACKYHDCDFATGVSAAKANAAFVNRVREIQGWRARLAQIAVQSTNYGQQRLRGMKTAVEVDMDPKPRLRRDPGFGNYTNSDPKPAPTIAAPSYATAASDNRRISTRDQSQESNTQLLFKVMPKNTKQAKSKRPMAKKGERAAAVQLTQFAPTAKASVIANQGPSTSYLANGDVRVRHRENLGEVTLTATTFTTKPVYAVNPGMASTFPWLSSIANRFDKYRIHKLKFYYESECATSATGSLMMAFDYNPTDTAPANKIAMMGTRSAVKTVPWLNAACTFDAKAMDHDLYVRPGVVPTTQDVKTYDPAAFYVATTNTAASGTIGDLWVEYDISLKAPSEISGVGGAFVAGGGINNGAMFGTYGSQTSPKGTLPGTWVNNTFTFNTTGSFIFTATLTGTLTGATLTTGTATLGTSQIRGDGTAAVLMAGITATNGDTFIITGAVGTVTASVWFLAATVPSAIICP
nr:structural protein [Tolivirales sp.]WRQ65294.1 structural protein [Tolivirales sp.]